MDRKNSLSMQEAIDKEFGSVVDFEFIRHRHQQRAIYFVEKLLNICLKDVVQSSFEMFANFVYCVLRRAFFAKSVSGR